VAQRDDAPIGWRDSGILPPGRGCQREARWYLKGDVRVCGREKQDSYHPTAIGQDALATRRCGDWQATTVGT